MMFKLNFKISSSTFTLLNRYAKSLDLDINVIIRFLLAEGSVFHDNNLELFKKRFDSCKYKLSGDTRNDYYDKVIEVRKYNVEVSEYIYETVQNIKKEFKVKTDEVVNNLIHMGLDDKFEGYESYYAYPFNKIKSATRQFNIHISNVFYDRLYQISDITGIKTNKLISLIIGNYLIEHFTEYDSNVYCSDKSGKFYYGIW